MRKKQNIKQPTPQPACKYQPQYHLFKHQYLNNSLNYILSDDIDMNLSFKFDSSIVKKIEEEATRNLSLNFIDKVKLMKATCSAGSLNDIQQYGQFINYDNKHLCSLEIKAIDQQFKQEFQRNLLEKRIKKKLKIQQYIPDFQMKKYQEMIKDNIFRNFTDHYDKKQTNQQLQSNSLYRQLFHIHASKIQDNEMRQKTRSVARQTIGRPSKNKYLNEDYLLESRSGINQKLNIDIPKVNLTPIVNSKEKRVNQANYLPTNSPITELKIKNKGQRSGNSKGQSDKLINKKIQKDQKVSANEVKIQFVDDEIKITNNEKIKIQIFFEQIQENAKNTKGALQEPMINENETIKQITIKETAKDIEKQVMKEPAIKQKSKKIQKKSKDSRKQKKDPQKAKRTYTKRSDSKSNLLQVPSSAKDAPRSSEVGIQFDINDKQYQRIISPTPRGGSQKMVEQINKRQSLDEHGQVANIDRVQKRQIEIQKNQQVLVQREDEMESQRDQEIAGENDSEVIEDEGQINESQMQDIHDQE